MKLETEEEMNASCNKPNNVFKFVKFMRKDGKDMHGGGGWKDEDGRLAVNEIDRGK